MGAFVALYSKNIDAASSRDKKKGPNPALIVGILLAVVGLVGVVVTSI